MEVKRLHIGKILYGFLFCALIPFLLYLWASHLSIFLPVPGFESIGITLLIAGFVLMLFAMLDLRKYGKGLPMNAFPPENFVDKG
jgi:hypothetical protein